MMGKKISRATLKGVGGPQIPGGAKGRERECEEYEHQVAQDGSCKEGEDGDGGHHEETQIEATKGVLFGVCQQVVGCGGCRESHVASPLPCQGDQHDAPAHVEEVGNHDQDAVGARSWTSN